MGVRQQMTMRLYTERNSAALNPWGTKAAPVWNDHLSGESCWVFVKSGGEQDKLSQVRNVYKISMLVPVDTDINEADRVKQITNRRGTELYGRMKIVGIAYKHEYKSVILKEWGGE